MVSDLISIELAADSIADDDNEIIRLFKPADDDSK